MVTGQPVHRLEDSLEVRALHRQQLRERAAAPALVARDDHLAHRGDAIALEEHVLGAAEPDALGAEAARDARVVRRVGVRAHAEACAPRRPSRAAAANDWYAGALSARAACRGSPARPRSGSSAGRREHASRRAVEREPVALVDAASPFTREAAVLEVDVDVLAADDGALAHAARDDGGVARHSAARGEHRARGDDAVKVLGRRLVAHEDHRARLPAARCSATSGSNTATPLAAPGLAGKPGRERRRADAGIDDRMQQLVELLAEHAQHGLALRRSALRPPSRVAMRTAAAAVRLPVRVWSR